jgi:hypothetical protein
MQPVSRLWLDKHTSMQTQWRHTPTVLAGSHVTCALCDISYTTIELGFLCSQCKGYITRITLAERVSSPCGGGVDYLHRSPVSHRRQRKGKSRMWDSKIWSQVPRDLDPRKTTMVRTSSIYKRQTCPLIREGAPQRHDRNRQRVINVWGSTPRLTDWLTVSRNVILTLS